MNKDQLLESIISKTDQKRSKVEKTLSAFWETVEESLASSEKLTIPAATLPYFKPGNNAYYISNPVFATELQKTYRRISSPNWQ